MKYVVLGGGGSFGLHTSRYLLDQPDTEAVLAVGRSLPKPHCFTLGVGDAYPCYSYEQHHITYNIIGLMDRLDEFKPDVVINYAAQGESATSFNESWRYFETNCMGLTRLVEQLRSRDWLKRFLHISTSELYGPAKGVPMTELSPLLPTSPYALSKAAFDQYLEMAFKQFGFPMTILRPSNCYGPGQQLHRIIPKAFLYGLTGRKLPLHGGGRAEKSFMHNYDLARAVYRIVQSAPLGSVYNAGPLYATSILDLVQMIAGSIGMSFAELCDVTEDREHQDSCYWLDSDKIRRELDWRPIVTWTRGLDTMRKWVETNIDELKQQPIDFVMRP